MSAIVYDHLVDRDEVEIKLGMDFLYYVVEPITHRILAKSMISIKDAIAFCKSNELFYYFNL